MSGPEDNDSSTDEERALLAAIRSDWGPAPAVQNAVRAALPVRLAEPAREDAPGPSGGSSLLRGPAGFGIAAAVVGAILVAALSLRGPRPSPAAPAPTVTSTLAAETAPPFPVPTVAEPPAVSIDSLPNAVSPPRPITTAPPAPSAAEAAGDLSDELALIRAAQSSRRAGDVAQALATLDAHAAKFPHGAMRDERMTLQALLLCDRGDVPAARAVRDELARVSPGSSHLQRLSTSCVAP